MWIHEHQNWPNFTWDAKALTSKLADVRHRQGRLLGRMESLGFELNREASLRTLTNPHALRAQQSMKHCDWTNGSPHNPGAMTKKLDTTFIQVVHPDCSKKIGLPYYIDEHGQEQYDIQEFGTFRMMFMKEWQIMPLKLDLFIGGFITKHGN